MGKERRKLGIDIISDAPWGTHLCHFYQTREDLIDVLVPYFKAGLENNEFCMWVTSEPLGVEEAKRALEKVVNNLDDYVEKGQIEILPASQWYAKSGKFEPDKVLNGWVEKEKQALERGFDGLRLAGNTSWLETKDWGDFADYEATVEDVFGKHRMIAICSYALDKCGASGVIDVVCNHRLALIRRGGKFEPFECTQHKWAEEALLQSEEKFRNIYEESPIGIELYDSAGQLLDVNKACLGIFGVSDVGEVRGFKLFEDPNVTDELKDRLRKGETVRYEGPFDFEKVKALGLYRTAKSGIIYLDVLITPLGLRNGGAASGYLVQVQDITERKQSEEALLKSQERERFLADVLERSLQPFAVGYADGRLMTFNRAYCELLGYSKEELLKLNWSTDLTPPEWRDVVAKVTEEIRRTGQPQRFEKEYLRKDGSRVPVELFGHPILDSEGNLQYYYSFVTDITKRKWAEEFSAKLFTSSPIGIYIIQDRRFKFVSPEFRRLTGYTEEELYNIGYFALVVPEDRYMVRENSVKMLKGERSSPYEYRYIAKDGQTRWVMETVISIIYRGRRASLANFMDITERKRAEEELRELNEQLENRVAERTAELAKVNTELVGQIRERELKEEALRFQSEVLLNLPVGVAVVQPCQDMIVYTNPRFEEMFGYGPAELIGKNPAVLNAPVTGKSPEEIHGEIFAHLIQYGVWSGEIQNIRKDGTPFWSRARVSTLESPQYGRVWVGFHEDITERKRAEEELRRSRDYLQRLTNSMWDAVFSVKMPERVIEWANDSFRITGYEPEECIGKTTAFLYPDESGFSTFGSKLESAIALGKDVLDTEQLLRRRNGEVFPAEITTTFFKEKGEVVRVTSIVRDITERKQAEEAVKLAWAELNQIFETVADGMCVVDKDFNMLRINQRFSTLAGMSEDEAVGKKCYEVFPGPMCDTASCPLTRILGGEERVESDVEKERKDGIRIPYIVTATPFRGPAGELIGIVEHLKDISERKRAEEALRLLSSAVEQSSEGIALSDIEGNLLFLNNAFAAIHGYAPDQLIGKHLSIFHAPEQMPSVEVAKRQILETGEFSGEIWHVRRDGTVFPSLMHNSLLRDEAGNPIGMIGTLRDITERKQAEEELRESKEFAEALITSMKDGFSVLDNQGVHLNVNTALCQMTGFTREELVGSRPPHPYWPEEAYEEIQTAFQKTLRGEFEDFELIFKRKNGERFPVIVSPSWTRNKGGDVITYFATVKDITERKQVERARVERAAALARAEELKRSRQRIVTMQESLRREIAQQVHGSVQNRIVILLHRLAELERADSPKELPAKLGDLRKELGELLECHVRPISHRLYPFILRRGLVPALLSLQDQFEAAVAIEMKLDEELRRRESADRRLILEQVRLAAYRIAEEALTNVVKHAKASRVTIELELPSERWLRLMVRDDGQGFDMESASGGLGLPMMQDYAGVMGGACLIRSARGQGTEVTAVLPLAGPGAQCPGIVWPLG